MIFVLRSCPVYVMLGAFYVANYESTVGSEFGLTVKIVTNEG
jgi:hypothetical protein